ncbi:hypothetical protein [Sodalis-like endosymbiont of Proechinophthirus fluctus]|uniref:hypothetical protein n=1 Tax=Sodalis-like endosymbiont of Proechinophthirus fluctus TaxID=1462730 RepID=UPI000AEE7404
MFWVGERGLHDVGLTFRHDRWFDTLIVEVADKVSLLARADVPTASICAAIFMARSRHLYETTVREDVQAPWQGGQGATDILGNRCAWMPATAT